MTKLLKWVITLLLIYAAYSFFINDSNKDATNKHSITLENSINEDSVASFIQSLTQELRNLKSIFQEAQDFLPDWNVEENTEEMNKPELKTPKDHPFSIYNITLGEDKQTVEKSLGTPQRVTANEYGISWFTYHNNYQNFVMVGYDENNKVTALYTNQDLIASKNGIKKGTKKEQVLEALGEPLKELRNGRRQGL